LDIIQYFIKQYTSRFYNDNIIIDYFY